MAVFMQETLKLSKTLKSSRDDFNILDNFNVSSIKTANVIFIFWISKCNADHLKIIWNLKKIGIVAVKKTNKNKITQEKWISLYNCNPLEDYHNNTVKRKAWISHLPFPMEFFISKEFSLGAISANQGLSLKRTKNWDTHNFVLVRWDFHPKMCGRACKSSPIYFNSIDDGV